MPTTPRVDMPTLAVDVAQEGIRMRHKPHTVELSLESSLLPWLDCFKDCTAQWGLITDVREDDSTYERHGIIITVSSDVTEALLAWVDAKRDRLLRRLRQSIDLVKLALAVDPRAVKSLLIRRPYEKRIKDDDILHPFMSEEELLSVAAGDAPFQLRLRLQADAKLASRCLRCSFADHFIGTVSQEPVDQTDALRRYLVQGARDSAFTRRLLCLPVRIVLSVSGPDWKSKSGRHHSFFRSVGSTIRVLHRLQRRDMKWSIDGEHAPLEVEKVDLQLGCVPLNTSTIEGVQAILDEGIPVIVSSMNLDFTTIECEEPELRAFLHVTTSAATSDDTIFIETGRGGFPYHSEDHEGEDFRQRIRMLLRCIGQIPAENVGLNLDGLFTICCAAMNRQATIRGLVESILPRSFPVRLSIKNTNPMSSENTDHVEQEAQNLRQSHPHKRLRLHSLRLSPSGGTAGFACALLSILDDIEVISTGLYADEEFTVQDIETILLFPSLRSLKLCSVNLPSMAIFSSTAELRLQRLELGGLWLEDSSSLIDFVERLNPLHASASQLSRTLERLCIAETDGTGSTSGEYEVDYDQYDREGDDDVDEDDEVGEADPNAGEDNSVRLAITDTMAIGALERLLAVNKKLRYVNFVGKFGEFPVKPVQGADYPAKTSHALAPISIRRSALAIARKTAFISAVHGGINTNACLVDRNIIQLIFELSSPHVERSVRV